MVIIITARLKRILVLDSLVGSRGSLSLGTRVRSA